MRIHILFSTKSNLSLESSTYYREKKFFLDLKYKKEISNFSLEKSIEDLVVIDKEYKLFGYKSINYKQNLCTGFTFYLSKKFLHSSLFGSIKLIKL